MFYTKVLLLSVVLARFIYFCILKLYVFFDFENCWFDFRSDYSKWSFWKVKPLLSIKGTGSNKLEWSLAFWSSIIDYLTNWQNFVHSLDTAIKAKKAVFLFIIPFMANNIFKWNIVHTCVYDAKQNGILKFYNECCNFWGRRGINFKLHTATITYF